MLPSEIYVCTPLFLFSSDRLRMLHLSQGWDPQLLRLSDQSSICFPALWKQENQRSRDTPGAEDSG